MHKDDFSGSGKDDRSKDKRSKMKHHQQHYQRKQPPGGQSASSSSAAQVNANAVRGIVDVADSSDERFSGPRGWRGGAGVPKQHGNRDMDMMNVFDEEEDSISNAQLQAGDFDMMSQLPTSIGGHFQFASEKHWEADDSKQLLENMEASAYFTLNLKLLNVGLQTIPFHKRMDYASSLFTNEQIITFEQAAENAEKRYQEVLKEHNANPQPPRIDINSASRQTGSAKSQRSAKASEQQPTDDLDELLNITTEQVAKAGLNDAVGVANENVALPANADGGAVNAAAAAAPAPADSAKDDIQQWLDNVLEE